MWFTITKFIPWGLGCKEYTQDSLLVTWTLFFAIHLQFSSFVLPLSYCVHFNIFLCFLFLSFQCFDPVWTSFSFVSYYRKEHLSKKKLSQLNKNLLIFPCFDHLCILTFLSLLSFILWIHEIILRPFCWQQIWQKHCSNLAPSNYKYITLELKQNEKEWSCNIKIAVFQKISILLPKRVFLVQKLSCVTFLFVL